MDKINGIILKADYSHIGIDPDIELLGKTSLEWVGLALNNSYISVSLNEKQSIIENVRPYVNAENLYTVVLYSDTPLITKKTVGDAVSVMASSGKNVLKLARGYVFNTQYLMSAINIYTAETHFFEVDDFLTASSFKHIALISDILKNRILDFHMNNGVRFEDLSSVTVHCNVEIAKGAVIGPFNILKGRTVIKEGAQLLSNNVIENTIIDKGAKINSSQIYSSFIGEGTTVGPYAYIRPDSVIGAHCRIGDFVEIKKSIIGDKTKVSHLSYVGDAEVGENCNIGCGVVFVNYDGKNKHKTKIENNVFVGSNCNIIAPVVIGEGAFIAAGSTITDSIKEKSLAIARARQVVKPDWGGNKYTNKADN